MSCLFATPWTVACQAPLSLGFPRQEYWSGLPFSSPGDLSDPGMEPVSPALQGFFTAEPLGKPLNCPCLFLNPTWVEMPSNPYQVHAQLAFRLQKEALPGLYSSRYLPFQEKRTLPNISEIKAWNLRMVRPRGRGWWECALVPTPMPVRVCFPDLENSSGFTEQVSPFWHLIMSWFWRAEGRAGREGPWGSDRGLEPCRFCLSSRATSPGTWGLGGGMAKFMTLAESLLNRGWESSVFGLSGSSDGGESACSAGDPGSIPRSGRSPGEGNGNPLQ